MFSLQDTPLGQRPSQVQGAKVAFEPFADVDRRVKAHI